MFQGDVEMNQQNGSDPGDPGRTLPFVRGRIEHDEKASADASHKKFSNNKLLPENRAKKKNGRA